MFYFLFAMTNLHCALVKFYHRHRLSENDERLRSTYKNIAEVLMSSSANVKIREKMASFP